MDQLPPEILENIFCGYNLSIKDVVSASSTCKHLRDVIYNNITIWRLFYQNNWPENVLPLQSEKGNEINWLEEIKYVDAIRVKLQKKIEKMPDKFYTTPDVGPSELKPWQELMDSSPPTTYSIVMWHLMKVTNNYKNIKGFKCVSLFKPGNLTLQYYCAKLIQYLRHYKLSQEHKVFMQLDERQRTLEKCATFIAQWCQPNKNIQYQNIQRRLDNLAAQAKQELFAVNPNHPLFKIPEATLLDWREQNLEHHQFDTANCQQILNAINHVLYRKNQFTENRDDFYNSKNSYIDQVLLLQLGLPILLCIVYESVARRLGVNCEPVNVPSHFLLRYQSAGNPKTSVFYVNAANAGEMFARGTCPYSSGSSRALMPRATALDVMMRMAANLENAMHESANATGNLGPLRSVFELSVLIAPSNLNMVLNLSRLCMSLNMDTQYIEEIILNNNYDEEYNPENVLKMLRDYQVHRSLAHMPEETRIKHRPSAIKYAVGQVMCHKRYQYLGVITAWTEGCHASIEWQEKMNVQKLKYKAKQPFYYVLVEDGTNRYVAEENIEIRVEKQSRQILRMAELGRHFSHFYKGTFIPNCMKDVEYPGDGAVRENFKPYTNRSSSL